MKRIFDKLFRPAPAKFPVCCGDAYCLKQYLGNHNGIITDGSSLLNRITLKRKTVL